MRPSDELAQLCHIGDAWKVWTLVGENTELRFECAAVVSSRSVALEVKRCLAPTFLEVVVSRCFVSQIEVPHKYF